MPGMFQEAIACFAAWAALTELRISCRPRNAGFALGSSLNLAPVGRLDHPPPLLSSSSQKALHVEGTLLAQHQVDGSPELGGQDRERLGLAVAPCHAPQVVLACGVVAKEEDGCLREGPLQVHVADLGAACAELLARRAVLALDEPRVREEVLDSRKAPDLVDLVEDRERQDLADPWDRAESMVGLRVVLLGPSFEMELEIADDLVVVLDQHEVDLHALAGIGLGEGLGYAFPVSLVGDLGRGFGEVVLVVGVLYVGEEIASPPDQVQPPSKQISGRPHLGRVDVSLREVPAAEEGGDLEGINLVVLGFASVDGLHVEGVTENELDALSPAEIGDPVPGEHALDGDDEG